MSIENLGSYIISDSSHIPSCEISQRYYNCTSHVREDLSGVNKSPRESPPPSLTCMFTLCAHICNLLKRDPNPSNGYSMFLWAREKIKMKLPHQTRTSHPPPHLPGSARKFQIAHFGKLDQARAASFQEPPQVRQRGQSSLETLPEMNYWKDIPDISGGATVILNVNRSPHPVHTDIYTSFPQSFVIDGSTHVTLSPTFDSFWGVSGESGCSTHTHAQTNTHTHSHILYTDLFLLITYL